MRMNLSTSWKWSIWLRCARTTTLVLNTLKTKEITINFRRTKVRKHCPLHSQGEAVEIVYNPKFLGITIFPAGQETERCQTFPETAAELLQEFSGIHTDTLCYSVVYQPHCCREEWPALSAENSLAMEILQLDYVYNARTTKRAVSIFKDSTHPQHSLYELLPSGKWFRTVKLKPTD